MELESLPTGIVAQLTDGQHQEQRERAEAPLPPTASQVRIANAWGRVRYAVVGSRSKTRRLELTVNSSRGADALPVGRETPFEVQWESENRSYSCRATAGRSRGNPLYFHEKIHETGSGHDVPASTARLLAEFGYDTGDSVAIEIIKPGQVFRIRPNPNHLDPIASGGRMDVVLDASMQVPEMHPHIPKWSSELLLGAIAAYNRGRYRGRSNPQLDAEGYRRFGNGIAADPDTLAESIEFVGVNYAGTQASLLPGGYGEESRRIADALLAHHGAYTDVLARLRRLEEQVPSLADTSLLLAPFHQSRSWLVWGTKVLHFLAPETMAILDPTVERALLLRRTSYTAHHYVGFLGAMQRVLASLREELPAMRERDDATRGHGDSISDLKIVDKVLYTFGG